MNKSPLILLGIVLLIIFNLFISYGLLWSPYSIYFNRPEFSYIPYEARTNYVQLITWANMIFIWLAIILSIIFWYKRNSLAFLSLLIGVSLSCLTVWAVLSSQSNYPNAHSWYIEDGYHFKTEAWNLDANGPKIYKRWKSKDSFNKYTSLQEVYWILDSVSKR